MLPALTVHFQKKYFIPGLFKILPFFPPQFRTHDNVLDINIFMHSSATLSRMQGFQMCAFAFGPPYTL
jgi:hypothetical protein